MGTVLKPVMNPDVVEENVADLPDLEEEEDLDDEVRNCVDEAEEFFGPQQPLLDFKGGPQCKQHILSVLVKMRCMHHQGIGCSVRCNRHDRA